MTILVTLGIYLATFQFGNLEIEPDRFDPQGLMPALAVENCKHLKNAPIKLVEDAHAVAKILYQVEEDMNIPHEMRGMTLAAACLESSYNPSAKGDRKFSKKNRPKAVGVLQMWGWYEKAYGVDRMDPKSSAEGWLEHIQKKISKVKKICKFKTTKRIWIAAWVTGVRAPKKGGRCFEKPKHYSYFKKLRKIYDIQTKKSFTKSGR